MAGIKDYAKEEAVLNLRGGGQIPLPLLEQRADDAMKRFYIEARILQLPVYMNQVVDQREYTVPDPSLTSLASERTLVELNRVTYDDSSVIDSRVTVPKSHYGFNPTATAGALSWKLELYYNPGIAVTNGLELVQAYSSTLDDYVPAQVQVDARAAVTALLRHMFLIDTGRPWTEPQLGGVEFSIFQNHVAKARIAATGDYTHREMTAVSPRPFII